MTGQEIRDRWADLRRRCKEAAATHGGKVPAELVEECRSLVMSALDSLDRAAPAITPGDALAVWAEARKTVNDHMPF